MRKAHAHSLRVLTRTRDFLARTQVTSLVGDLEARRKELDVLITQLASLGDQTRALTQVSRSGTLTVKQLARRLRRVFIRPVVRAGRRMTGPETEALRILTVPRVGNYEQLASTGNAFADLVERQQEAFVAAGLSPDAAAKLRTASAELLAAVHTRSTDQGQRVAKSQGARATAAAGHRLLRLIDALVDPSLESDPAMVAEWRSLVRIGGRSGGGEVAEQESVTPAPSGPVEESRAA